MKSRAFVLPFVTLICFTISISTVAQQDATDTTASKHDALGVYVDCRECPSDYYDYLITELTFVNFVRDRKQSDVHVLVSTQSTGGGGDEITMEFIGRDEFSTMVDTLKFFTVDSDTDDMTRKRLAARLRLGLVRYLARTQQADDLAVTYSGETDVVQASEETDPWNYWVFTVDANTWMNGQKSVRSLSFWGQVRVRRNTEQSKTNLSIWGNYNEDKFDFGGTSTLSISRSKGFNGSYTYSLGDHWGARFGGDVWSSTFSNRDVQIEEFVGAEYNIYPYSESTSRQFRIAYEVTQAYIDYSEETVFDKNYEWLTSARLRATVELIQPWGSVETSLTGSHFFHDFGKNRLRLRGNLSVRIVEGLSISLRGNVSRVRDQLNLAKGGATDEEVLLRRLELATDWDYWTSIGFSYSFGSIYNNVVNARFGGVT